MTKLETEKAKPEIPEFWVSVSFVEFQPLEKVEKQFLFFQCCSPVKHSGIILERI